VLADSGSTPIPRVGASRRKAYIASRFRFRLRFRESAPVGVKRILLADSGSIPIPRVGASRRKECPLFKSAGTYSGDSLRRVGADSRSPTVYRNDFLILVPTLGNGVGT